MAQTLHSPRGYRRVLPRRLRATHNDQLFAASKRVTFEYIEVFYNRIRRHAKINNQIPADFAKTFMEKLEKIAA